MNNFKAERQNSLLGYITFLISPILTVLFSLKNYNHTSTKNIVWLFTIFYAYHFVIPNEGADMNSYIERFANYTRQDYIIKDFIFSLYAESSTTLDVVEPLVSYLTSRITSNEKVLLVIYGIIYGYFFSRNIAFFLEKLNSRIKLPVIPLMLLLLVTMGIWNINGFRFWCASHIFIYGVIQSIFYKNNKSVLFILLSCFVHLGMLIPSVLAVLFRFTKQLHVLPLLIAYLLTFFIMELNLDSVREQITNYSPNFMSPKLTAYTSEAYVETVAEKHEGYSAYFQISRYFRMIIVLFLVFCIYTDLQKIKFSLFYRLFIFILLLGTVANILSQIPSGGRYLTIVDFLLYGVSLVFLQNYNKLKLGRFFPLISVIIFIYALYGFRIIGIHTFSIHHFINNPIVSLFIY